MWCLIFRSLLKSSLLIFWLNFEYFEYRQGSNRSTNKKVTGFKKNNFTTFFGKTKMFTGPRYVCLLCFYFHFCILKEFRLSKPPVPESTNPTVHSTYRIFSCQGISPLEKGMTSLYILVLKFQNCK